MSEMKHTEGRQQPFGLSFQRHCLSILDRSVFQDFVGPVVQRDGQRLLDAIRSGDIKALSKLAAKYECDAGLSQGGGGAGPGKFKSARRGAVSIYQAACAALSKAAPKGEESNHG